MYFQLKAGSVGPNVRVLQTLLNFLQVAKPPLLVDGIFGPKTRAAVISFQGSMKLKPDGIVGPLTTQTLVGVVLGALITKNNAFAS